MIVEVRTYKLQPGKRDEFIELFLSRAVPEHEKIGMKIFGPLLDMEDPDRFVFLRGFPSLEERDRMKDAFYEGSLWKNELEAIAMPMIDVYSSILTETAAGWLTFAAS